MLAFRMEFNVNKTSDFVEPELRLAAMAEILLEQQPNLNVPGPNGRTVFDGFIFFIEQYLRYEMPLAKLMDGNPKPATRD